MNPKFLTHLAIGLLSIASIVPNVTARPNIVFILADDLGYGDLGCFGQEKIKTPQIDQMAAEGMKLTDFYAGATVCAPSRCVLMTGKHTGRCWTRGNANGAIGQTLQPDEVTVASLLKGAGYNTALIGKWGLGELGSTGHPNAQGFDYFHGYLNQRHAHNFYPEFLIKQGERVPLRNVTDPVWKDKQKAEGLGEDGAGWATPEGRIDYTHDLFATDALEWLDEQTAEKPFFLYFPLTIPHANNEGARGTGNGQEVPDYGIYESEDWTEPNKGQAAMITRMDKDVGRVLEKLREKGLAENTLVIFTSDNGHHKEGGNDPEFFDANGPLKGMKRDLTEGGIRVPTIAWWPGKISPGSTSDHVAYFGDVMATAAELAGQPVPADTQSISFLPTLIGNADEQKEPEYLYWEFYERGGKQAVRFGDWKAIRIPMFTGEVELFDLSKDIGEENNLASEKPEIVAQAVKYLDEAHVDSPHWKVNTKAKPKKK